MKENTDNIPDIHSSPPDIEIPIKAGFEGLITNTYLSIGNECVPLTIDIAGKILLPKTMRGAHMSRFIRAIDKEIKHSSTKCDDPFSLLNRISLSLLDFHEYTEKAIITMKGKVHLASKDNQFSFIIKKIASRTEKDKWIIDIRTKGSTSCPSAREVFRFVEKTMFAPTHMQRAQSRAILFIFERPRFDLGEIASILEKGFSGKLYRYLSRYHEYELVKQVNEQPRFTEDVARITIELLKETLEKKHEHGRIKVIIKSYESIHPFNIVAEAAHAW